VEKLSTSGGKSTIALMQLKETRRSLRTWMRKAEAEVIGAD